LSSKQRRETEIWTDIFKNLPVWGEKHGVHFTEEERDGSCLCAAERCFSTIFAIRGEPQPVDGETSVRSFS
jgi:hypothetical protein